MAYTHAFKTAPKPPIQRKAASKAPTLNHFWIPPQSEALSEQPMPKYTPLPTDWDASQHPLLRHRVAQAKTAAAEKAPNQTGMPDRLKAGLEQLSGLDLSEVRVHRNSSKPKQLQALAYTQGTNIYLGPGQEQHLPHEGWHVVQQMEGQVEPTMQMAGEQVNDEVGLEREAGVMGGKALQLQNDVLRSSAHPTRITRASYSPQAQSKQVRSDTNDILIQKVGEKRRAQKNETIRVYATRRDPYVRVRGISGQNPAYNQALVDEVRKGIKRGHSRDAGRFYNAVHRAQKHLHEQRSAWSCAEVNAVAQLINQGYALKGINLSTAIGNGNDRIEYCEACRRWIGNLRIDHDRDT